MNLQIDETGAWMGIEVPQKANPKRKAGNDVKTNDGWYDFSDAGTIV